MSVKQVKKREKHNYKLSLNILPQISYIQTLTDTDKKFDGIFQLIYHLIFHLYCIQMNLLWCMLWKSFK